MNKVIFFSGAGLSADSGLGTFRGTNGIWNKYDINKVCNYSNWLQNYNLVHEFYNLLRLEYEKAKPNLMHKLIAKLQNRYGTNRVIIITQNIDNLLEQAECNNVLHIHGKINFIHCKNCLHELEIHNKFEQLTCIKCNSNLFKPSIVFFNEQAPLYTEMYSQIGSLEKEDLIVVIGTEGSVVPINSILGSKTNGIKAKRILCNLNKSPYIDDKNFDHVFYMEAIKAVNNIESIVVDILN